MSAAPHTPDLPFWTFRTRCCTASLSPRSCALPSRAAITTRGSCHRRVLKAGQVRAWVCRSRLRSPGSGGAGCLFWTPAQTGSRFVCWTNPSAWWVCFRTQYAFSFRYRGRIPFCPCFPWTSCVHSRAWTQVLPYYGLREGLNQREDTSEGLTVALGDVGVAQPGIIVLVVAGVVVLTVVHSNYQPIFYRI